MRGCNKSITVNGDCYDLAPQNPAMMRRLKISTMIAPAPVTHIANHSAREVEKSAKK